MRFRAKRSNLRKNCAPQERDFLQGLFKDNNASQLKSGKFDPRSLRNPWTDRHLNLHGWLCQGPLPLRKFSSPYDYPLPLHPPNMRKCESTTRLVFLVLPSAYSQDPCIDFHDQYVKLRGFAQGCVFWGSQKRNFTFRPHFPPKTQIFRQVSTGHRKFSIKNALTMGMLTCKLPLIVIIAKWKLYSE